jgi:hypothetical protein
MNFQADSRRSKTISQLWVEEVNPTENWGLKPSLAILRHQTTFLGVKTSSSLARPLDAILYIENFATVQKSHQSELVCKSYASYKLTY